jgi:peroxiredoxin
MKTNLRILSVIGACAIVTAIVGAARVESAPAFTLKSSTGKDISLDDFKGKYVVLEWWNYGCPFVRKHYDSKNMQTLQRQFTSEGVVWLTICSSAEGKQGYVSLETADAQMKKESGAPTHILLDPNGTVGKLYKAKTTPHMFLISPKGEVLYQGAIDSIPSANPEDIKKAENYLVKAYKEALDGKPIATAKTQPYGCSVKYAN